MRPSRLTIEDRPTPGTSHINTIIHNRRKNVVQVALVVVRSSKIPENRLQAREFRLEWLSKAEFRDLDVRHAREQVLGDLAEEPTYTCRRIVKPTCTRVRCRSYWEAVWCRLGRAGAFRETWVRTIAYASVEVFDAVGKVGCVRIDGEEVARTCYQVFLVLSQSGEYIAESVFEDLRIVTVIPL